MVFSDNVRASYSILLLPKASKYATKSGRSAIDFFSHKIPQLLTLGWKLLTDPLVLRNIVSKRETARRAVSTLKLERMKSLCDFSCVLIMPCYILLWLLMSYMFASFMQYQLQWLLMPYMSVTLGVLGWLGSEVTFNCLDCGSPN